MLVGAPARLGCRVNQDSSLEPVAFCPQNWGILPSKPLHSALTTEHWLHILNQIAWMSVINWGSCRVNHDSSQNMSYSALTTGVFGPQNCCVLPWITEHWLHALKQIALMKVTTWGSYKVDHDSSLEPVVFCPQHYCILPSKLLPWITEHWLHILTRWMSNHPGVW